MLFPRTNVIPSHLHLADSLISSELGPRDTSRTTAGNYLRNFGLFLEEASGMVRISHHQGSEALVVFGKANASIIGG
jgi:hypothetical protein